MKKAWLYIRSTPKSPPSSQRERINKYLRENKITILGEEIERSGTKGFLAFKRILQKAERYPIILSNITHLRSLDFLELLESAKDFVILEHPACRPDTIKAIKAKAIEASKNQSVKLKETFKKLKKQGVKLGATRPGAEHVPGIFIQNITKGQKAAAKARFEKATKFYVSILPLIVEYRKQYLCNQEIANELNDADLTLQNGSLFHHTAILRLAKRWEGDHGKIMDVKAGRRDYQIDFPFKAGPYKPPRVAVGDMITDHFTDKLVKVIEKRDGWPIRKDGSFILTGGLVLAVLGESTNSICSHWKVTHEIVRAWKEKLAGRPRNIQPLLAQKLEEVKQNADTWSIRTS